jgi:hypothetical protein
MMKLIVKFCHTRSRQRDHDQANEQIHISVDQLSRHRIRCSRRCDARSRLGTR